MSKKVLVITGSARKNGNSNTLAQAFARGVESAGGEVFMLDACALDMDGCHGDGSCHERGWCGLKDDGVKLHEYMGKADVLVLATPLYWKSFSSQIKKVIDRFYCYAAPKGRAACTVKEAVLLVSANNPDKAVFGPILEEYDLICKLLNFKNCGTVLANGLGGPNDIDEKPEYLEEAVRLGIKVAGPSVPTSVSFSGQNRSSAIPRSWWL